MDIALLKLTYDILWVMERQEIMAVTYMDISAAFDTVDHDILLHVLNKVFGITDTALKWCESDLRPRNFRVSFNGKASADNEPSFSVPQGSCATILMTMPAH